MAEPIAADGHDLPRGTRYGQTDGGRSDHIIGHTTDSGMAVGLCGRRCRWSGFLRMYGRLCQTCLKERARA